MQLSLSCITPATWTAPPPLRGRADIVSLTLSGSIVTLRGRQGRNLYLGAEQLCRVTEDEGAPRPWCMTIVAYAYLLRFSPEPDGECLAWHWHPATHADYHLHVSAAHHEAGEIARLHVPAGPVGFPAVVRFLITELDVVPLRSDWEAVLAAAERDAVSDEAGEVDEDS